MLPRSSVFMLSKRPHDMHNFIELIAVPVDFRFHAISFQACFSAFREAADTVKLEREADSQREVLDSESILLSVFTRREQEKDTVLKCITLKLELQRCL